MIVYIVYTWESTLYRNNSFLIVLHNQDSPVQVDKEVMDNFISKYTGWVHFIFSIGSVKAIFKSIKNSREYPTQEEKKRVVEQFQDHYLLKVHQNILRTS